MRDIFGKRGLPHDRVPVLLIPPALAMSCELRKLDCSVTVNIHGTLQRDGEGRPRAPLRSCMLESPYSLTSAGASIVERLL